MVHTQNINRSAVLFFALFGCLVLTSLPSRAQDPEVRSLAREGGGPARLDRSTVAPLFDSGPPLEATEQLQNGEASACRDNLRDWTEANSDHPHIAEARFVYGYCAHESGSHETAMRVLQDVAESLPILRDHAHFFAAQSAYSLDQWDAVVAFSLLVPADSVYGPRSSFLRARALRRTTRALEAVGVLQDFVRAYPRAYYIADVEFELARSLSEIGELEAAADMFQRVSTRYPGNALEESASENLAELLPQLSDEARLRYAEMDDQSLLARARALFGRHRSDQVIALLDDQLDRLVDGTTLGCEAAYLVAKSYSKLRQHADSLPYYERVFEGGCSDEDLVVKSLYQTGRGLWNIDRDQEAITFFRRLYTEHPDHSYADDAMLYEARVERANENESGFLAILEEQLRRFPEGDMLGDANWLLFEHEFSASNYAAAIALAEAISDRTGENTLYNRGRIAYFAARAHELSGDSETAVDGFLAVARDVPLSYYALLALNRVQLLAPERAETALEALRAGDSEETDSIVIEPAEIAESLSFQRGLVLLRLGLLDLSRRQFDRLTDEFPNQDSLLWLVSFLFDRAGAYHISHDIPRRQIESFLSAYPSSETTELWQIAYPTPFADLVEGAAEDRDVDRFLIYAIMREESGFNPRAESWANARGLMQLMEGTAETMGRRVGMRNVRARDLFRAQTAVELGSEYLNVLGQRYNEHPALTIAGYNGGEGNVDRWVTQNGHLPIDQFVEEINYRQTRDYTKRVLMTYWIYHWLYDSDEPLVSLPFNVQGT